MGFEWDLDGFFRVGFGFGVGAGVGFGLRNGWIWRWGGGIWDLDKVGIGMELGRVGMELGL